MICLRLVVFMGLLSRCSSSRKNTDRLIFMQSIEYVGVFDLFTFEMTLGDLPEKAQRLVQEWLRANAKSLIDMWNTQQIHKLPPLE